MSALMKVQAVMEGSTLVVVAVVVVVAGADVGAAGAAVVQECL